LVARGFGDSCSWPSSVVYGCGASPLCTRRGVPESTLRSHQRADRWPVPSPWPIHYVTQRHALRPLVPS